MALQGKTTFNTPCGRFAGTCFSQSVRPLTKPEATLRWLGRAKTSIHPERYVEEQKIEKEGGQDGYRPNLQNVTQMPLVRFRVCFRSRRIHNDSSVSAVLIRVFEY